MNLKLSKILRDPLIDNIFRDYSEVTITEPEAEVAGLPENE